MRNYVIINGVNSLTIQGLAIKTMPPITKPIQRTLREEIDGRDGDIVTTLGYGAYDKTIEIGLFGTFDIDEVIAYFNQKGTITFSNEADKVYYFQALEQVDYAELLKFRTANVVLHCQPFKYPTEETPLEEEYEYVTGTGTNITLNNTEETEFNEIELQGNTSQVTYTGKNLLDKNSIVPATNATTITQITNGVQIKNTSSGYAGKIEISNLETNTNYYLSYNWENISNGVNRVIVFAGTTTTTSLIVLNDSSGAVFNTGNNTTINIWFYAQAGNVAEVRYTYIQLEKSSTQTDFEPYVGGVPSPNPSYPQPIQVVSGDNEISICGKNLLEIPNGTYTSAGNEITAVAENGVITLNGTSTATRFVFSGLFFTLPKGTYSIKANPTSTGPSGGSIRLTTTESAVSGASITFASTGYNTFTTTEDLRVGLQIRIASGTTFNNFVIKPQLEVGDQATDWEIYNGETYPLYLGVENLFNKDNVNSLVAYIPSNGTITNANDNYMVWLPIKQNTNYTIKFTQSAINTSPYVDDVQIGLYTSTPVLNATGTRIYNQARTSATEDYTYQHTFNSGNNSYVAIKVANITRTNVAQTLATLQVEVGSKANHYTSYGTTPIEMAFIPNTTYKDIFVKENGTWYKRAKVGKTILDSSTNWTENTEKTYVIQYLMSGSDLDDNIASGTYFIMSNYFRFKYGNPTDSTNEDYMWVYQKKVVLDIRKTIVANRNALKTWIGENKPIFYYQLATPTDIEITNETLANQLEAIWNATSYRGQTNITQVSNDLPFMMEVSALKLGSDHLEINNTGNIYSKPTIELEGTGIVDIYLNDVQVFEVDLSEENKITIDTEKMEAYTDTGLANRKVTGDYSTFKLNVGTNDLRFSGALTSATISRYIRWL